MIIFFDMYEYLLDMTRRDMYEYLLKEETCMSILNTKHTPSLMMSTCDEHLSNTNDLRRRDM